MKNLINAFLRDPFEAFGYVVLGIFMLGMVIRFGKHVWKEIVND